MCFRRGVTTAAVLHGNTLHLSRPQALFSYLFSNTYVSHYKDIVVIDHSGKKAGAITRSSTRQFPFPQIASTMSAATMTSQSDITTLTLPTAGVGGSYYDMAFEVPVYPNAPINMVTWRGLDTWNNLTTKYTATQGIGIGLVWATMTYLLALTPNQKRKTAFHSFLLLGLAFLLIHMLIDLVSTLTPGIQTSSAYTVLTLDVGDSVWTRRFVATFSASQVTAWFAFGFAAICLFIQSRGLMTGLKVRRPRLCRLVLGFLALSSVATLGTAMAFSIYEMTTIRDQVQDLERSFDILWAFHWAYSLSYTICIGSYSLVSMISIVDIVWKRPAAISGGSVYASALNLVGLLCAQSFVVPCKSCRWVRRTASLLLTLGFFQSCSVCCRSCRTRLSF